ncbi:MAG TPA: transposase [Candidatus Synoicihabitans sp.]|nr:transposase [Candidatus Synoicihabitans sp.]
MSKPRRARRQFTTEQKAAILRRNMVDKEPVSEICNELGLQPSLFYQWQRQMFENLAAALSGPASEGPSRREKELTHKVAHLEERLAKKDSVIAEISAEYVQLKKELGEP